MFRNEFRLAGTSLKPYTSSDEQVPIYTRTFQKCLQCLERESSKIMFEIILDQMLTLETCINYAWFIYIKSDSDDLLDDTNEPSFT